jgi:hypothetical protein
LRDIIVLDLTVFGLDPEILELMDLAVPIVFQDDAVRLQRRLWRDTREPEEQPGSRGDSRGQVMGDFFEKQFQELANHAKFLVAGGQLSKTRLVWYQDTNELREILPNDRGELRTLESEREEVQSEARSELRDRQGELETLLDEAKQEQLQEALGSIAEQKKGLLHAELRDLIASTPHEQQISRIDSLFQAAIDRAVIAPQTVASADQVSIYVTGWTEVSQWDHVIRLLNASDDRVHVAIFTQDSATLEGLQAARAELGLVDQERVHVGIDRATLMAALAEHYNITTDEMAHVVTDEALFRDKSLAGVYRNIWLRAATLTRQYRVVEFSSESAAGRGTKISIALEELVKALRLDAAATEAQARSA